MHNRDVKMFAAELLVFFIYCKCFDNNCLICCDISNVRLINCLEYSKLHCRVILIFTNCIRSPLLSTKCKHCGIAGTCLSLLHVLYNNYSSMKISNYKIKNTCKVGTCGPQPPRFSAEHAYYGESIVANFGCDRCI